MSFEPSGGNLSGNGDVALSNPVSGQVLAYDGTMAKWENLAPDSLPVSLTTQTSSYALALGDAGKVVEMNGSSALTITVPPNSSVAFPIGTIIEICQMGSGQVTVAAGSGVTIRTPASLTTRTQYASVSLRKRAIDEWVLSGDLT